MILDAVHAPLDPQRLGLLLADKTVGDHPLQHFREGETVLVRGDRVHAGEYTMSYVTLCKRRRAGLHSLTSARRAAGDYA